MEFYNKKVPKYIYDRSGADQLKRKKLDEIKSFEETTDKEYAKSLGAVFMTSQEGTEWAFFHQIGNSAKGFLVEGLKTLDSDPNFKIFISYHKKVLEEKPVEKVFSSAYFQGHLLKEYDIVYVNDDDQRDDDQDPGLPPSPQNPSVAPERVADSGNPPGPVDRLSTREQSGAAGHPGNNATTGQSATDRSEDGEGQTPSSPNSISDTIAKIRSHSPDSQGL